MQTRLRQYFIVIISLSLFSCTDEPKLTRYKVFVKNQSSNELIIEGYDSNNSMIYSTTIHPDDNGENCTSFIENFDGLATCNTDSLVFKFSLSKGYICALRQNGLYLCFNGKSPFDSTSFKNLGNNTFEFEITQEDYDNAYDLPE